MYCNNCGKQIPDNANFCNHCGAKAAPAQYRQSGSAPRSNPAPQPKPAQPQSRPSQSNESPKVTAQNSVMAAQANEKKGGGFLLVIVVFVVCYLLGKGIGGNMLSSKTETPSAVIIPPATTSSMSVVGYPSSTNGLFFDTMLPDAASYLVKDATFYSPKYAAYVGEYDNDSLMLLEYGYKDDVVQELENTLIIPTQGWSHTEIGNFLNNAEALIDELHAKNSSFTGTASVLGSYEYVYVEVRITNLHNSYTIQDAVDEELVIDPDGSTPISMSKSDEALKDQGFARK